MPYQRLAADVWDLLRQDGGRFQRLCELLPREALTLLIGGSPCQDVSPMGPGRGRMGLCGEGSIHFFVFPALAWAVARARPDLTVHVVVENAGSIRPEHLLAMSEALGVRVETGILGPLWMKGLLRTRLLPLRERLPRLLRLWRRL